MQEVKNTVPEVSVAIPVYNHDAYVSRAIDSVLKQKTNFDFEVIIGDDYSTDTTREILLEYEAKYPGKIVLILPDRNRGVFKNVEEIYRKCRGKYIATLDGDDYWIYDNKLQEQFEFLEANDDYVACFHDALIESCVDQHKPDLGQYHHEYRHYSQFNKYRRDFFVQDVIERNIIPTASLFFRNSGDLSDFFKRFAEFRLSLIWAIQIYIVKDGKMRYFNEVWSAYNDHAKGVSKKQSLTAFKLSNIQILKKLATESYLKYARHSIYKTICSEYRQILLDEKNARQSRSFYYQYLIAYCFYYLRTLRHQINYIARYRKYSKNKLCAE